MRKNKIKNPTVYAVMVSEETLEIVERWVGGAIKGTKLPRSKREIEFYSAIRDEYLRARRGDYIVEMSDGMFDLYSGSAFRKLFEDIDEAPY